MTTMHTSTPNSLVIVPVLVFFLVVLNVFIAQLPVEVATNLVREGEFIELLTVWGYFFAVLLLFIKGLRLKISSLFSSAGFVLLLAMRELDFHSKFTTMGIFKTKFYVSSTVPVMEKCVVSLIVFFLIVFMVVYVKEHFGSFWIRLRQRTDSAIFVALGIGAMVFSKFLDSCSDFIEEIVVHFYSEPVLFSRMIEETTEMMIPLLFSMAALYYKKDSRE